MKKYYVGLMVLALVVLGLAGFVISKGVSAKTDKQTYEAATEIAAKLNDYIQDENAIPESLQEVGITDVPSTISYRKVTTKEYEFCTEFKSDRGYGSADITSVLYGTAINSSSLDDYEYKSDYKARSLYMNWYYKKGKDCQTIEPYVYQSRSTKEFDICESYPEYCENDSDALFQSDQL